MAGMTIEARRALLWLSKQRRPMWGGVYDRRAHGDTEVMYLLKRGYVEGVAEPYTAGRTTFSGGYRITETGRLALTETEKDA